MKKIAIYVHIPFCKEKKCNYCNFVSYCKLEHKQDEYVSALATEIRLRGKTIGKECEVTSIYIGGGSPSTLDMGLVARIIAELKRNFKILPNAEISIELNPGSIEEIKLLEYKLVGINRVSIGGQTMNDKILSVIGRTHDARTIKASIDLVKKAGFTNINVDMMLALPNQKLSDVKKMAKYLVKKKIPHISAYALILEQNTPLYKMVRKGEATLPTEDQSVEMYNLVYKILKRAGYKRYEVSNFALPDYECAHNQNYWEMGEYLAFGVAGHSYYNNSRFSNTEDLKEYLSALGNGELAVSQTEKLSLTQKRDETMMLALRTSDGLNIREFDDKFGGHLLKDKKKEIEFLTTHNFISVKGGVLRVCDNAYYVLNAIITKLI